MSVSVPDLFRPIQLRQLCLNNRLVVSPMCQYSCNAGDGLATDWHLVHLGSRAVRGAGLIFTEAAAVTPEGRISPQDLGFWSDQHTEALDRARTFCQEQGAAIGVQLAHAGRKASTHRPWEAGAGISPADGGWTPVAPGPEPHAEGYCVPRALGTDEIQSLVVQPFAAAADRAHRFGYDVIEIHAAHGYLLHEFLSPLANHRQDSYGGSFDNRSRSLLEVVAAVRRVWPESKPLFVRISATDWVRGGCDVDASVALARKLKEEGVDVIDCSSGGVSPAQQIVAVPGYQVPFAERIRHEAEIATAAVGLITNAEQAQEILARGQADLIVMARQFLREPYFPLAAAHWLDAADALPWPVQYERARPRGHAHPGQRA
jgi:2,4-dienoyl-CoA reductase-like NADH-dependent reductase (Old Yellow Enzyme family)